MPTAELPEAHYLWIGPPGVAGGQDTIGPDLLQRRYKDQPIHFWCLDAHAKAYQTYFSTGDREGSPIQVHSIEAFIASKEDDYPDLPGFVEVLKSSAEKNEDKADAIRERVTIKDMTQYFLQIYHEGYFLDSNIIPEPDSAITDLPAFDHFTVPKVFSTLSMQSSIDPWLMYSPSGDKKGQRERFERYLQEAAKEFFSRDKTQPEIDRKALSRAFFRTAEEHPDTQAIDAAIKRQNAPCIFGFQKRYQNTHKPSSRGIHNYPKLHLILNQYPALEEFEYLFEHTVLSANEPYTIPDPTSGKSKVTTLINTATESGQQDIVGYLLTQVRDIQTLFTRDEERSHPSALDSCLTHKILDDDYECLKVILTQYFHQTNADPQIFFHAINMLATELAHIYDMPSEPVISIHSIEDLQAVLKGDVTRRPAYQKAVSLCLQIGPLTAENKAQYLQALQREHLHHQRTLRAASETIFSPLVNGLYTLLGQPPAPLPKYDTKKMDQDLTTYIQHQTALDQDEDEASDVTAVAQEDGKSSVAMEGPDPNTSPTK